jgi:hypothetical protein
VLPQRSDTVVKTATTPKHPGVASLVSEIAIGGASATADEYIFTAVSEVLPLRDGSILVIDRGDGNSVFLRMYDARGKYLRTLGRHGEGPGEYMAPSGLGELPDGRIVLRDGAGGRLTVYTPTGENTMIRPPSGNGTSTGSGMLLVTADGTIHVRMSSRPALGVSPATAGGYLRVRADGTVIDTLPFPDLPHVGPPDLVATRTFAAGSSSSSNSVPYSPSAMWAFSPLGYFVTGQTTRYAVELRMPPARNGVSPGVAWKVGDPVVSIRRTVPAVAINDAERTERRASIEESLRAVDATWQWTGPDVPRVKPPYRAIRVAADGRLWVQLSTPSERFDPETSPGAPGGSNGSTFGSGGRSGSVSISVPAPRTMVRWREPTLYDVFEPDGSYVGQVAVPYDTSISVMKGDLVWGSTRDADGVQTVRRFHIGWK